MTPISAADTARDHPLIAEFTWQPTAWVGELYKNEIGAVRKRAWFGSMELPPDPTRSGPAPGESYFEWLDILAAVKAYRPGRPFVFAELGAGFGQWSVNAILALRQKHPHADYRIVAVEAYQQHVDWLLEHLPANGIDLNLCRFVTDPLAGNVRDVHFQEGDPADWYGQSIIGSSYARHLRRNPRELWDRYFGRRRKVTVRRSTTLSAALDGMGVVDLIDMDIQGAEAEIVESSLALLHERVMRMHIETHSTDVEQRLRAALGDRWRLEQDYPCGLESPTPYGIVHFQGGVQSWVNPRYA